MRYIPSFRDLHLPRMVRVRQTFSAPVESNTAEAMARELAKPEIARRIKRGQRVAIAVGSRGIAGLEETVAALVQALAVKGARPFIVPAMGSHGGATAEGQRDILASYGITAERVVAPVISSMEVVELGRLANGTPVYFDREAYQADAIIPVNRVKLHTAFRGEIESGLAKMLCIGLGKHRGATALHSLGMPAFSWLIPEVARIILAQAPVAFGLAILENAYGGMARLEAVPAEEILTREKELLKEADSLMARILIPEIDVLVVDRIGKEISGEGMDPNVVRRFMSMDAGFQGEPQRIVVLDLTEKTRGNAIGIGMADLTTKRLVDKVNFFETYTNTITTTVLSLGRLPLVMESDLEAIGVAINTCAGVSAAKVRLVRIADTKSLEEIQVSESLLEVVNGTPGLEALGEPFSLQFDAAGNLF